MPTTLGRTVGPVSTGAERILIVRHGATEWSAAGRHTGRTDVPLTAAGRTEAEHLGQLLKGLVETPPVHVFTSPLGRATETARLAIPGATATVVDSLAEWDYGSIEGRTTDEVRAVHPGWDLFGDGTPDGESLHQVAARTQAFIAKMERMAAAGTVIVFGHGHAGRVLTALLLGWPAATAGSLYSDTASVAMIDRRRGQFVLRGWNLRSGRVIDHRLHPLPLRER